MEALTPNVFPGKTASEAPLPGCPYGLIYGLT